MEWKYINCLLTSERNLKYQYCRTFGAMASIQAAGESLVMVVGGDQDPDTTVSTVELLNRQGRITIKKSGSFC